MARWTPDRMPSPEGLRIVITGANAGIGYEAARQWLERGADVTMACRNPTKAEAALASLRASTPNGSVETMSLDLADLDSVRAFAAAYLQRHDRLDRLVLNAGIMVPPLGRTVQGFNNSLV